MSEFKDISIGFEDIFNAAPDAMVIVNKSGKICLANNQIQRIFGYEKHEIIDQPIEILVPKRYAVNHKNLRADYQKEPKPRGMGINQELYGLRKDGSEFPVEISLSPIYHEGETWVCSAIRDVTEKKQLNQQNLISKEQLRNIFQNVPGVIYRCKCEKEWPMIMISKAVYQLTGYSQQEFVGESSKSFEEVIHPDDREMVVEATMEAVENHHSYNLEYRIHHKDGSLHWVSEKGLPVYDTHGIVKYLDGVIFDITANKEAGEALIKAKNDAEAANRSKSSFLANMSHELRTPMNAIIGYSEMLIEDLQDTQEEFVSDLDKIRNAGKHLLSLINDILDLSKVEAGRVELILENVNISELVSDIKSTTKGLVEKNGNTFIIEVDPDIEQFDSDYVKLKQCLLNLLSNASKFTHNGEIGLNISRDIQHIQFVVSDTGIGIAEQKFDALFDEFTQADDTTTKKYGGTGLGLAITKRFVQLMGGEIDVQSEPGKGSEFTIHLPLEPDQALDTKKREENKSSDVDPKGKPILVIEDDDNASELIKRIFKKEGYEVITAKNGVEGLKLAKKFNPYLITLDLMIPNKNGWTVLSELKNDPQLNDIPVIIISVLDNLNHAYTMKAEEYLTKPVKKDQLLKVVNKYLAHQTEQNVLIIDDDPDIQNIFKKSLEKKGLNVLTANNGQEGLDIVKENAPSLILLDLMMPTMDGFEFLSTFKTMDNTTNIPVIVVTSMALSETQKNQLNQQVMEIVLKNAFDEQELVKQIKSLVSSIRK